MRNYIYANAARVDSAGRGWNKVDLFSYTSKYSRTGMDMLGQRGKGFGGERSITFAAVAGVWKRGKRLFRLSMPLGGIRPTTIQNRNPG